MSKRYIVDGEDSYMDDPSIGSQVDMHISLYVQGGKTKTTTLHLKTKTKFQWPWLTTNPGFQGHGFYEVEYLGEKVNIKH